MKKPFVSSKPAVYEAPWEKGFDRILSPIEEFIQKQSTSSLLLMLCTLVALVVANSPWGAAYGEFLHQKISVGFANTEHGMSVVHWINDGLMVIFFLMIGLELKRELLVGELSDIRQAMLPIFAAAGGMLVPAALFFFMNREGIGAAGWGIPMATDIAFAVGALTLLGNRVPRSLIVFLIALAIVDDLGAVLVIAVFYTGQIHLVSLAAAGILFFMLVAFNLGGVRRLFPYLGVGVLLWLAMLSSGIHATIAGILVAFCIPIQAKYNPAFFLTRLVQLAEAMKKNIRPDSEALFISSEGKSLFYSQMAALEHGLEKAQAPAARLEESLHVIVAYLVIPLFALANAAIPVDLDQFSMQIKNPVTMGVVMGLCAGKLIGITGATWLAIRLKIATLPHELDIKYIVGVGLLSGIGFTMSIFIADLAFSAHTEILLMAKLGILLASALSACLGIGWILGLGYFKKREC